MCETRSLFFSLFSFLAAAFSWAEAPAQEISPPLSQTSSSTESPPRTPLEIASELYKHTGTLADGLTELATESETHTSEQGSDTKKASELVKDSSAMQSSRDTATTSLENSIESSQKADSMAAQTIEDQAVALSSMKRSRDFWRTTTIVSVVLGTVFTLLSSL